MSITDFLTARYDEDETAVRNFERSPEEAGGGWIYGRDVDPDRQADVDAFEDGPASPDRILADIAAKRAIVENLAGVSLEQPAIRIYREGLAEVTLRMLAQPYADHPDFDPAWRVA